MPREVYREAVTVLQNLNRSGVQMTGDQPQRGVPAPQGTHVDLDLFSETVDVPAARSDSARPAAGNTSGRVRVASTSTLDIFLRKTLTWRQAAEFVATLADMLAGIHGRGDFHGAICPEWILLKDDGNPELTNFDHPAGADGSRGVFVGPCTAPERILVEPLPADARSDVYALGIMKFPIRVQKGRGVRFQRACFLVI